MAPDNPLLPVLIVGASVRAAAWSARRAGYAPMAIDHFADVDLLRCCPAIRVDGSRPAVRAAADRFPAGPWMYTGGLENDPQLVGDLSATRELYGNPPSTLRRIRDPVAVASAVRAAGFFSPRVLPVTARPGNGTWLLKSTRSSGGSRIRRWTISLGRAMQSRGLHGVDPHAFLQQWVEGEPVSAVYVAGGDRCQLVGVTVQIVGESWTGGRRFQYAGSIGPLRPSDVPLRTVEQIGRALTERFELRGLFGVDLVAQGDRFWVIEVNPRYTASVEILERGFEFPALEWHVEGCCGREPTSLTLGRRGSPYHGKAIVYARRDVTVDERFVGLADRRNHAEQWPGIADLPAMGSTLRAGQPVTTVFAAANRVRDVARLLREHVGEVRATVGC